MKAYRIKRQKRFLVLLLILSFLAMGVSLYASWFIEKFVSYSPSHYEPKDQERQKLFEETGKSVVDQ